MAYKKVLKSLQHYPLPLLHRSQALALDGVGPKVAGIIEKIIEDKYKHHRDPKYDSKRYEELEAQFNTHEMQKQEKLLQKSLVRVKHGETEEISYSKIEKGEPELLTLGSLVLVALFGEGEDFDPIARSFEFLVAGLLKLPKGHSYKTKHQLVKKSLDSLEKKKFIERTELDGILLTISGQRVAKNHKKLIGKHKEEPGNILSVLASETVNEDLSKMRAIPSIQEEDGSSSKEENHSEANIEEPAAVKEDSMWETLVELHNEMMAGEQKKSSEAEGRQKEDERTDQIKIMELLNSQWVNSLLQSEGKSHCSPIKTTSLSVVQQWMNIPQSESSKRSKMDEEKRIENMNKHSFKSIKMDSIAEEELIQSVSHAAGATASFKQQYLELSKQKTKYNSKKQYGMPSSSSRNKTLKNNQRDGSPQSPDLNDSVSVSKNFSVSHVSGTGAAANFKGLKQNFKPKQIQLNEVKVRCSDIQAFKIVLLIDQREKKRKDSIEGAKYFQNKLETFQVDCRITLLPIGDFLWSFWYLGKIYIMR